MEIDYKAAKQIALNKVRIDKIWAVAGLFAIFIRQRRQKREREREREGARQKKQELSKVRTFF